MISLSQYSSYIIDHILQGLPELTFRLELQSQSQGNTETTMTLYIYNKTSDKTQRCHHTRHVTSHLIVLYDVLGDVLLGL